MSNEIDKLNKLQSKYETEIGKVCDRIGRKIDFDDFNILYQHSDGWVIEHNATNSPLGRCMEVINKKGRLSLEDYLDLRI